MKKIISSILIILMFCSVSVFAIEELKKIESKNLNSGNGVCEFYSKDFAQQESDKVTINGEKLDIQFLGNDLKDGNFNSNWIINDYEGVVQNHDFFTSNSNKKLKSVRFEFPYNDDENVGKMGFDEQQYYPFDCLGFSKSTGLVSEVKVRQGWNLVPFDVNFKDCYYALEGEMCKDDILVEYFYIPSLNKYFSQEELEEYAEELEQKYSTEEEMMNDPVFYYLNDDTNYGIRLASKWIYVKKGSENKRIVDSFGYYIPYREQYMNKKHEEEVFNLYKGWNFLFADAFMIYDDNWEENSLSLDDMKGDCNIEKAYGWDYNSKGEGVWNNLLDEKIPVEALGMGFVVKVSDKCTLGYDNTVPAPPQVPN